MPDYESDSTDYLEFVTAMDEAGLTATVLTETLEFSTESANFTVYPPEAEAYESENDYSLVVSVEHGENRFLFAGDAEEARLEEVINQTEGEYTLLKVPHHGRLAANSETFFETVNPEYAVITSSDKNTEEEEVVSALEELGTTIYLTREGNIQVSSDGNSIQVVQ
ncbi:ComEC/Rec2 family competence protein [Marinilactibacillus psychrotolerans]|uniref:ComEC/Rec2 family competence protein n=1 Tax=Marinilactibacillus psychrotolerans TaxID=191770 RepID=A0ABW8USS7_9LACT